MGFKKYQSVEKTEVVSKQGHAAIADELRKTGKTSVGEMSDSERATVSDRLDEEDS
jgi:hypothetical protein